MRANPELRIEYPSAGATYSRNRYGVYAYDTYPRSSVLAGQQRRVFLDDFATLPEAQAKYPEASFVLGSGYIPIEQVTAHLPGEDDPDHDE